MCSMTAIPLNVERERERGNHKMSNDRGSMLDLGPWFSKCAPWTSSSCIPWGLSRNANSQLPSRPTLTESIMGLEPRDLGDSDAGSHLKTTGLGQWVNGSAITHCAGSREETELLPRDWWEGG